MAAILLFVLEIQTQGLQVQVFFNDIEVYSEMAGIVKTTQMKINPYIIEGENNLRILLGQTWPEDEIPKDLPDPMFKLLIVKGEHGVEPSEEGVMIRYEWNQEESPLDSGKMTPVYEENIQVDTAFGTWSWEKAPASELTTEDSSGIAALMSEIHTAFSAKDISKLGELLELKNGEMARSLGLTPEAIIEGQNAHFRSFFESDSWKMEPLDTSRIQMIPLANGRLVRIQSPSGEPPLNGSAGARQFVYDIMVTQVDGKWIVAR